MQLKLNPDYRKWQFSIPHGYMKCCQIFWGISIEKSIENWWISKLVYSLYTRYSSVYRPKWIYRVSQKKRNGQFLELCSIKTGNLIYLAIWPIFCICLHFIKKLKYDTMFTSEYTGIKATTSMWQITIFTHDWND